MTHMLETLERALAALPSLLKDESTWQSVYVDYHLPYVERLWRPWNDGTRLYLHRIHACPREESLFHPHPWPSAMIVLDGEYEMSVGFGSGDTPPLGIAATLILPAGARYEMTEKDAWHSVRPITPCSMSFMVTGTPWDRSSPKSTYALSPLDDSRKAEIFDFFRSRFPS